MNNENFENTINLRQAKDKEFLLECLKKMPIVETACARAGIGRSTFYRWRKEDKEFWNGKLCITLPRAD